MSTPGRALLLRSRRRGGCGRGSDAAREVNGHSLFDVDGATFSTPTAPGIYAIVQQGEPAAKAASMAVSAVDATCQDVAASDASAMSGTVTLTNVSGNSFDGNFDITLDSGDHITGDFSPEACPALQTAVTSTTPVVCK